MKDALFLKGQVIFPESILNLYSLIHPVRSKENNYIFLGGGDALRYLAGLMYKNIRQHLSGTIHLVRTYLIINFSIPFPLYAYVLI